MSESAGYGGLGIAELTDRYRRGVLSPIDVVEDSLARAEASVGVLNAFVTICRDVALRQAEATAKAFRAGLSVGPLAGVPITVKDILPTKGVRTTYGSAAFATNIPSSDAVSYARLAAAGAIMIGKTATPEFACRQTTSSVVSGIARNPLNLELTPGGSSGGSAAAIAAGIGHLSLVTDGGGSARLPAASTGIVGMKPTFGRIPFDTALDAFGGLGHIGLMARNAADLETALLIASGPAPANPFFFAANGQAFNANAGDARLLDGLRIGFRMRLSDEAIDPEFIQPIKGAMRRLQRLGADVCTLEGEIERPLPIWQILQHSIWAERYGDRPEIMKRIDPVIATGIEHARMLSAQKLQAGFHGRTRLFRHVQRWFEALDFIATPTLTRPPLPAAHSGRGPIEVDGKTAGDIREAWAPLLGLFTMTGHPAVSLNCGWTEQGLPIGLQLVGRWHEDDKLLRLTSLLERAMPEAAWRMPAPRRDSAEAQRN